jgi:hypothetical protein
MTALPLALVNAARFFKQVGYTRKDSQQFHDELLRYTDDDTTIQAASVWFDFMCTAEELKQGIDIYNLEGDGQ